MKQPAVSIIMSVYKDRGKLKKSINSVLKQDFTDFEFIIIDDASPDNVLLKIKSIQRDDKRVKVIQNKVNLGLTKSLNKGLSEASGKYIARIDEGDLWDSKKIIEQVKFLEEHPTYSIVGSQYKIYSDKKKFHHSRTLPRDDHEIRKWLLKGLNPFIHSAILFRNMGLNYNKAASTSQDFELYLRLYFTGKMANLRSEFTSLLIQSESISTGKEGAQFYNHLIMHRQFLKVLEGIINRDHFVKEGVDFSKKIKLYRLRRSYMNFILNLINHIGKRSKVGRFLKNLFIPDILLYSLKKKIIPFYYSTNQ